jgi:hypothetical protein
MGMAVTAALGATFIPATKVYWVLLGLGVWSLCSTTGSISGIAAIQNRVPAEHRGVGMALLAFCNTLLGLGLGPTLVALVTERVYGSALSIGLGIATIALPAAAFAAVVFVSAIRVVAASEPS